MLSVDRDVWIGQRLFSIGAVYDGSYNTDGTYSCNPPVGSLSLPMKVYYSHAFGGWRSVQAYTTDFRLDSQVLQRVIGTQEERLIGEFAACLEYIWGQRAGPYSSFLKIEVGDYSTAAYLALAD